MNNRKDRHGKLSAAVFRFIGNFLVCGIVISHTGDVPETEVLRETETEADPLRCTIWSPDLDRELAEPFNTIRILLSIKKVPEFRIAYIEIQSDKIEYSVNITHKIQYKGSVPLCCIYHLQLCLYNISV